MATETKSTPAPQQPPAATPSAAASPAPASHPAASPEPKHVRREILIAVAVLVVVVVGYYVVRYAILSYNTVSTDDAYVNGHVTFVAPRVAGQVEKVLVDDNYRVHKGQLLVTLDKTPFQIIVDTKQAARDVAATNVNVAKDQFRAEIGQARAARFKLQHAVEDVDNQIALLASNVAKLKLADADYKRALEEDKTPGVISKQQIDQYRAAYDVALQQVYQTRVSLGLPKTTSGDNRASVPANLDDLSSVPENLDQTFSTVRAALYQLMQAAANLGITASSYNLTPKELLAEFYKRSPTGDIDEIFKQLEADAPTIKFAEAQLQQAQSDLDQANLNLSYCDVYAEIDGVVTSRNVNPGNNVVVGQSLMAVRSLTEIWIDANFKETQLANLRIGQTADLDVDMYGSRQTFKGRISGFEMGTGSTLALLPPENATGNFVKVVQRLPVRIEVVDYDPNQVPLFVGLSVTPYVYIHEQPTGPDADKFLQRLESHDQAAEPKESGAAGKPESPPPQPSAAPPHATSVKVDAPPPPLPHTTAAKAEKLPPPSATGASAKPEKKP